MSDAAKLKVVSIAHPAVSRAVGRLRYYPLAARRDFDIHLVVPARWHQFGRTMVADPPDDPGLNVHVLPIWFPHAGPMNWYLHVYPQLRRLVQTIKPDVIHLWEEPWSLVALQAAFTKGNAALVMEVDQNILKRLPPPFEAIRRYVLARTDYVLSRSPDATAVVRARGYRGPVSLIGYGVDQQTFRPAVASGRPNTGGHGLRIGYVGRIVEEKGLDDALDAIARTRAPMNLAILGEGPYEASLRARAEALGIADRLTIQKWGAPTEVARFLQGLDVLVLLTRTSKRVVEQFGRVIVEAQSCGVPVIGSRGGAIPSVVGEGGWIVAEQDPAKLAELLDHLAADPAALSIKARLAEENVATRFTYDIVAEDLAQSWFKAAEARGARSAAGSTSIVPGHA